MDKERAEIIRDELSQLSDVAPRADRDSKRTRLSKYQFRPPVVRQSGTLTIDGDLRDVYVVVLHPMITESANCRLLSREFMQTVADHGCRTRVYQPEHHSFGGQVWVTDHEWSWSRDAA